MLSSFWRMLGYTETPAPASAAHLQIAPSEFAPPKENIATGEHHPSVEETLPLDHDWVTVPSNDAGLVNYDDKKLQALQNELQQIITNFRNLRRELIENAKEEKVMAFYFNPPQTSTKPWPWQRDTNKELECVITEAMTHLQFCYTRLMTQVSQANGAKDYQEICNEAIELAEKVDVFLTKIREIIADAEVRESNLKKFPERALEIAEAVITKLKPELGLLFALLPIHKSSDKTLDFELHARIQPELDQVTGVSDQYIAELLAIHKVIYQNMHAKLQTLSAKNVEKPLTAQVDMSADTKTEAPSVRLNSSTLFANKTKLSSDMFNQYTHRRNHPIHYRK